MEVGRSSIEQALAFFQKQSTGPNGVRAKCFFLPGRLRHILLHRLCLLVGRAVDAQGQNPGDPKGIEPPQASPPLGQKSEAPGEPKCKPDLGDGLGGLYPLGFRVFGQVNVRWGSSPGNCVAWQPPSEWAL